MDELEIQPTYYEIKFAKKEAISKDNFINMAVSKNEHELANESVAVPLILRMCRIPNVKKFKIPNKIAPKDVGKKNFDYKTLSIFIKIGTKKSAAVKITRQCRTNSVKKRSSIIRFCLPPTVVCS